MTTLLTEAKQRRYTVIIGKGSAATNEIRTCLQYWEPGESYAELLKRVQQTDALGKRTARRTRDVIKEVFRPRLLTPDDRAARAMKQFIESSGDPRTFKELVLLYTARAEDVLYDFVVLRFWPACRAGTLLITMDEVLAFFDEAVQAGHIPQPWSTSVQLRVARSMLGALRDFGFIREEKRGRREIVPYRMTDGGVAYLAHELHLCGLSDAAVVEHPDWGLFGLGRDQVLDRLDGLGPAAGLFVQRAGSVVRITWSYASMESLIDALTR